jgi:hypothetical protein
MPRVYFDTDVFHRIGDTFADWPLAAELRERILVSPITALEALSHLTLKSADEILRHIQAMHNWLNPAHAGLLPWPDDAIRQGGFNLPLGPDEFTRRLETTFNTCLNAQSAAELREPAVRLKEHMDGVKWESLKQFTRLVVAYRLQPLTQEVFLQSWFRGIARRVKADADRYLAQSVASALSAYYEYEEEKLRIASENPEYRFEKHQNDLLDAEQLVYLTDPDLRFLTCDSGYERRIAQSSQRIQISTVSPEALGDPQRVETLLRHLTR